MDKSEFIKEIDWLTELHKEAVTLERKFKNGANKKIRKSSEEDLRSKMYLFERKIENNPSLFNKIYPKEMSAAGRTIYSEGFENVRHFTEDLSDLLVRLNQSLKNYTDKNCVQ
ncbi:hypothetical protein [Galbibacter orientalis]|uniref:Uncharacterized protein n=1 Tax=Galbibacter orientalis DSM 19592 TaxID=926559 RepID=I3C6Q3_9FLAO|nr:hypothetical protein [Galbibacter orientalis]EIJ39296.1 hypothetical protein JoomaDRAFT_2308 [Galbibacter orientalis DSM 19592]